VDLAGEKARGHTAMEGNRFPMRLRNPLIGGGWVTKIKLDGEKAANSYEKRGP